MKVPYESRLEKMEPCEAFPFYTVDLGVSFPSNLRCCVTKFAPNKALTFKCVEAS